MAERTYGDAACSEANRNAATMARWIANAKALGIGRAYSRRVAPTVLSTRDIGFRITLLEFQRRKDAY
jgi:hypothetical protein